MTDQMPNQSVCAFGDHTWFDRLLTHPDMLAQEWSPHDPKDQVVFTDLVAFGWLPSFFTKANEKYIWGVSDKRIRKWMKTWFKSQGYESRMMTIDIGILRNVIRWHKECVLNIADPHWDDRVRLAPSGIAGAGQGVFATRDIREGEIVCYYPCHIRRIACRNGFRGWDFCVASNDACQNPLTKAESENIAYATAAEHTRFIAVCDEIKQRCRDYAMTVFRSPKYDLDVWSDPAVPVQNKYLGAFLNDAGFQAGVSKSQYLSRDTEHNNCLFSSPIKVITHPDGGHNLPIQIFASRDIPAGAECLLPYGYGYWQNRR